MQNNRCQVTKVKLQIVCNENNYILVDFPQYSCHWSIEPYITVAPHSGLEYHLKT